MIFRDAFWHAVHSLPEGYWRALTWLGDSGLLLPAALLIALWLLSARRTWPSAGLWLLSFGIASLVVLASKLAFLGWGIGSASLNFTGFSGHTMLSAAIWPVALWLVASRATHRTRVLLAVFGWVLAAAIGVSRLALYAHSGSEVAGGYALGVLTSAAFLAAHRMPHPALRASMVVVSLLLPLAYHEPGNAAPTQGLLEVMAVRMAGIEHPFTREDLYGR
jgi:membrane-associated phospholipid phosphatase